jgi:hypothetical protein
MSDSDSVKSRLISFLEFKSISKAEFGRTIGVSSAYVTSMRKSIQPDKLKSIAESYPDLNTNWLLTGEGEMLNHDYMGNVTQLGAPKKAIEDESVPVRFYEVNPTACFIFQTLLSDDATMLNVIPAAGEKIDENSCLFKIHGDSMSPQIQSGSIVLCQEIKPTQWHSLKDCVAVVVWNHDMEDYAALKRISKNHLLDTPSYILLSSDNPEYPEKKKVALGEIRCIFEAVRIVSQKIS